MNNFVLIVRNYNIFQNSVWVGDTIAVEWIHNTFKFIWLALGKHNHFNIGLTQLYKLYARLPYVILHQWSKNRFLPKYKVTNIYDIEMKEWELDKLIEDMNGNYKYLYLYNDIDRWMRHSQNLTLYNKARAFSNNEYCCHNDVQLYEKEFIRKEWKG